MSMPDTNYAQTRGARSADATMTTTASFDVTPPAPPPADPWVHRSSGMRCVTCIWFVAKERNGPINPVAPVPQAIGRCRRHAPTMGGYPVVFASDWCGDHRLDENKA